MHEHVWMTLILRLLSAIVTEMLKLMGGHGSGQWQANELGTWTGNKAGRALKAPCVPWRWRKQSRNVAEQQARLKEVGIAELGGRHCTSELQPSVMKLGDVWIKLVMLLCERKQCREAFMGQLWLNSGWGHRESMAGAAEQGEGMRGSLCSL